MTTNPIMRCFFASVILINFHLSVTAGIVPKLPVLGGAKPKAPAPAAKAKAPALPATAYLSSTYYMESCPNLEAIINQKLIAWFKKDFTLAAAIIRLHFHDCVVRGCDASILLNHQGSEMRAEASKTLRGYTVIDDIKTAVEEQCPKTVSCADILTTAARDATVLAGGPFWEVPLGRKDGLVSLASEANSVPQGQENITHLIDLFTKLGLTYVDLTVLSGIHTIGKSSCFAFWDRIYNFNGTGEPDPSMNKYYVNLLRRRCKLSGNVVDLDLTTPRTFDVAYYKNLGKKLGLLGTDQALYSDMRTSGLVNLMAAQPEFFTGQFAVSMIKLGNANVLVNNQGQTRLNCNYVNPKRM